MFTKVLILVLAISSVARADSSSEEAGRHVVHHVQHKPATYGPVQPAYTTTTKTANSHSHISWGTPARQEYAPRPTYVRAEKPTYVHAPSPVVHTVYRSESKPVTKYVKLVQHQRESEEYPAVHTVRAYAPAVRTYAPAPIKVVRTYAPQPSYAPRQVVKYTPAERKYVKKTSYVKQVPAYAPKATYTPKASYAPKYQETYEDAKYDFTWAVKAATPAGRYGSDEAYGSQDAAEYGHTESRDYGKTTGKYWVQLPDGRLQTVEYIVDGDSGYLAKVSYSGADEKYSTSRY